VALHTKSLAGGVRVAKLMPPNTHPPLQRRNPFYVREGPCILTRGSATTLSGQPFGVVKGRSTSSERHPRNSRIPSSLTSLRGMAGGRGKGSGTVSEEGRSLPLPWRCSQGVSNVGFTRTQPAPGGSCGRGHLIVPQVDPPSSFRFDPASPRAAPPGPSPGPVLRARFRRRIDRGEVLSPASGSGEPAVEAPGR